MRRGDVALAAESHGDQIALAGAVAARRQHHPIGDVSEDEMLGFLIEQKGVTQVEAARGAGIAESTISEVLSGKRRLTRGQIEKLAAYFHVSPAVFLSAAENSNRK